MSFVELLSSKSPKAVQGDQALFKAGWIPCDRLGKNDGSFLVESKGEGVRQGTVLRSYGPEDRAIGCCCSLEVR